MLKNILNKFADDRKFFSIVFFILFIIVLIGIVSPIITNKTKENWDADLAGKVSDIERGMQKSFLNKQELLTAKSDLIATGLVKLYGSTDSLSPRILFKILSSDFYRDYHIGIYDSAFNLIAWTENYNISTFERDCNTFKFGETFFYNIDLFTYLAKADLFKIGNRTYYLFSIQPFEKYFNIDNKYINKISFSDYLSNKFLTEVNINYTPDGKSVKDARKHSFDLYNNGKNKIGSVNFSKPSLPAELNAFSDKIDLYQSLLIVFAGLVIGFGFRKDFSEIKYKSVKLGVIAVYCIIIRIILFEVGFPSNILEGAIVDPNNFSSMFGYGLVKSPVELFITSILVLIVSIKLYHYYTIYISESKRSRIKAPYTYPLIAVITAAFLFLVRGLAAIIKSIVFDSKLRYFKNPDLIPDSASLLMNLNVFLIGFVIVIYLLFFLLLIIRLLNLSGRLPGRHFIAGGVIVALLNFLFVVIQENPLVNYSLTFLVVLVLFILLYHVYYVNSVSKYNLVYIAIAGSIISITYLSFFNSELERESLKTIALELNRPNENIIRFYVDKTLNESVNNKFVIDSFNKKRDDMNAAAFSIWSQSPLHKESAEYFVFILDLNKKITGYFSNSLKNTNRLDPILYSYMGGKAQIFESASPDGKKIISGINTINNGAGNLGYTAITVIYSGTKINSEFTPEFLISSKSVFNDVLNSGELSLFTFENKKLIDSYGNLFLSKNQTEQLFDNSFSEFNEKWVRIPVTGENYLFYVLKNNMLGKERITAVALREKQISMSMYNFFKLFLIHTIYIFFLFVVIALLQFKRPYTFRLSFRAQLLTAFLFMSLLPILSLAVYNRHVVSEKSRQGILNELKERGEIVENSIDLYSRRGEDSLYTDIYNKITAEQKINFSIFKDQKEVYSSVSNLTSVGILPKIMNPRIYNRLMNSGFKEYSGQVNIDALGYTSFNKKIVVDSVEYILNVNSAVNRVNVTISSLDIDIFLFGVYSFAAIIIAVIGTVLANKISSPIRRLTKATSSVAHGDFNLQMPNAEKGEIKDLINGFNIMTKELSKRQTELAEIERETAWKEMARQVAHEIKNPLTPMKLAMQQLIIAWKDNHPSFNNIFEKVTSTVLNQIDTLNTIATEFSNFARMPNYNLETIDLIPVVKDTLNLFIDEKIEIKFNTVPASAFVEGDNSQLRRIIINLVRNSIQAGATKLNVLVVDENEKYHIIVSDNGAGISEDNRAKIFEQNFTTKDLGMGLGLKLAKKFIESVGGRLYLKHSSASGSEFVIELNKKAV